MTKVRHSRPELAAFPTSSRTITLGSARSRSILRAQSDSDLFRAAEFSPFFGIEKGLVLQEARIFNSPHIDARRCQQVCKLHQLIFTQWSLCLQ